MSVDAMAPRGGTGRNGISLSKRPFLTERVLSVPGSSVTSQAKTGHAGSAVYIASRWLSNC